MSFSVVLSLLLGSNHYGIAGWYTMKAVEQGLLVSTLCMNGFGVYYIIMYQLMILTQEAPLT